MSLAHQLTLLKICDYAYCQLLVFISKIMTARLKQYVQVCRLLVARVSHKLLTKSPKSLESRGDYNWRSTGPDHNLTRFTFVEFGIVGKEAILDNNMKLYFH